MISIALCTCNGEKYITAQLDSLAAQSLLPDELVVLDDASVDATLEHVRAFALRAPFAVRIYEHQHPLGVSGNFSEAIGCCQGDYIALCDQDDVWLPDKLQKSMLCMAETERCWGTGMPVLVHTDLRVVDDALQEIAVSMFRAQGLQNETDMCRALKVLLVQNYVTGCTVLFNRPLLKLACPLPVQAVMHDWWLALSAAAGGRIAFVDEPLILYRQHGGNQVGAKKYISWNSVQRLFCWPDVYHHMGQAVCQSAALGQQLMCRQEQQNVVFSYLKALRSASVVSVYRSGVHKQGALRNAFFYGFLFLWRKRFAALIK